MRIVAGDKFTLCKNARFMSTKIRMCWSMRTKRAKMPQNARYPQENPADTGKFFYLFGEHRAHLRRDGLAERKV